MKTILFFKSGNDSAERYKLGGFHARAKDHGWNVQLVEPVASAAQARKVVAFWQPDGVVVSCIARSNDLPSSAFGTCPVVFLGRPLTVPVASESFVCLDVRKTTEIAARELLKLDLRHYAYVHWTEPALWDAEYARAFADIMRFSGKPCSDFHPSSPRNRRNRLAALTHWLRTLPHPLGVFAVCDPLGADVIEACRMAGLSVPWDVAVVANNTDVELCENTTPSLSSIEVNLPLAGRLAADVLARHMAGSRRVPVHAVYDPIRLVRRASSLLLTEKSRGVEQALERIRRESCSGLTARQVLADFTCSRRMAELQFRAATGKSILEAIQAVRLDRARTLLSTTDMKLDAIANFCGYRSAAAFSNFYRAQTGHPPRRGCSQMAQRPAT